MNQQPTVILLKFTDFLNNLDSLAFLRLCHSFWSSHRSLAGRYRLKPKVADPGNPSILCGPRPSALPLSFFSSHLKLVDDFSPIGNFLVDSINLASLEDFRLFNAHCNDCSSEDFSPQPLVNRSFSSPRRVFDVLRNVFIDSRLPEEIPQLAGLPQGLETLKLNNFASMEKLLAFLKERPGNDYKLVVVDLSDLVMKQEDSRNFLDELNILAQLEILRLPSNFDCPVASKDFPQSLKELTLGKNFSSPILSLPPSLEILRLSRGFDNFLPPLPSSLRELELGDLFDFIILPGQLPPSLKILKIGFQFNQPCENGVFPPGLEELSLGYSFRQQLPTGALPASLKRFRCFLTNSSSSSLVLPESLEILEISLLEKFSAALPKWPNSLKSLTFLRGFHSIIESIDFFPPHLRVINFSSWFFSPLKPGIFPSTVEEINLPAFNHPLELSAFPSGLKKISFGAYNHPLPVGIFPDGIKSIHLGHFYEPGLAIGLFPSSVRELWISTKSPLVPGVFPEGVESITFSGFNEHLVPGIFPSSLRRLKFERHSFQQEILPGVLPEFLLELSMGRKYFGYFPLDSLTPYFLPDVIKYEKTHFHLKDAKGQRLRQAAEALLARYGEREFLMNSLRVSIGPEKDYYVVLSPVAGDFPPPFIVHHSFIDRGENIRQ